jgi:hypothetical protein
MKKKKFKEQGQAGTACFQNPKFVARRKTQNLEQLPYLDP